VRTAVIGVHGTKSRVAYTRDRTVCPSTSERNRTSERAIKRANERDRTDQLAELISQRRPKSSAIGPTDGRAVDSSHPDADVVADAASLATARRPAGNRPTDSSGLGRYFSSSTLFPVPFASLSVCVSVCLSHAGIVSKRLNLG